MGRDSRGRAQEAQWKLMLQGTKVRLSVQRRLHHGASTTCLLHAPRWRTLLPTIGSTCMQYADRLPIGLESIIRNVPAETVKAFYDRWYRPENMAVVTFVFHCPSTCTHLLCVQHRLSKSCGCCFASGSLAESLI